MKTLKGHTICYDGACPMCDLYTRAFVRTGMLDASGRRTYQGLSNEFSSLDSRRAVNEIALVNRETGEVHYGIDSLFAILSHAVPFLNPIFRNQGFRWSMTRLYRLISYNRRIIIPGPVGESAAAQPSFYVRYRLAFLFLAWIFTASILTSYCGRLHPLIPATSYGREFLVCGGQIFWQLVVLGQMSARRKWDYLGNMMTISLAGALALLPALWLYSLFSIWPEWLAGYFLLVAGAMLLKHVRRTGRLGLGPRLTISWALYRLVILLVILA